MTSFQSKANLNNSLPKATVRNKVCIPIANGECFFYSFDNLVDKNEHIALVFKKANLQSSPLVRIHSECLTGDVFGSAKCDCGDQLQEAINMFQAVGGILIYLRQEGRGIGLYNKLDAYTLQNMGFDTFEANKLLNFAYDLRDYRPAAQILQALNNNDIQLLSNNPDKLNQLKNYGIKISNLINTQVYLKTHNQKYLTAKKTNSGHQLNLNNPFFVGDYHD